MHRYLILLLIWISGYASAHEFTPTYPKMKQSHVENVVTTKMKLFNLRKDVEYYEIEVFNQNWEPVEVAVPKGNPIKISHLKTKMIDIYLKNNSGARYICSTSKLILTGGGKTAVRSRICSKIK